MHDGRMPSQPNVPVYRNLTVLILLVVAMALPFIRQPFHMDDALYMDLARNTLRSPLYPNDLPYVFEGRFAADMASHSHPPFQAYFLSLILLLFGEGAGREWIYHSCCLVFPVLAAVSFYFLCERFLHKPFRAALLFACCPILMVMEHNLMTDVPNVAFWLASIAAFIYASEKNDSRLYAVSAVFQFCAMFTSYPSAILVPLLGFYHFRSSRSRKGWIALLAPLVLMAAWIVGSCIHYDRFVLAASAAFVIQHNPWSLWNLGVKLGAALQYQGWLILFPIFFLPLLPARKSLIFAAGILAMAVTWFASPRYQLHDRFIYGLGILIGVAIVYHIGTMPFRALSGKSPGLQWTDRDKQFLWLWYFGVTGYFLLLYTDGSARYILPLVPPVILCFCRILECSPDKILRPRVRSILVYSAALFTAAWGLALSQADMELATIYPRAVREFSRFAGQKTSYYGGEWGFRYYFDRAGFRQLTPGVRPLPEGSLLVTPGLALPYELKKEEADRTRLLQVRTYTIKSPIRLLDSRSTAGFYSTYWGKLPFAFSRAAQETIELRVFF